MESVDMNTRELTPQESEKEQILKSSGFNYALLFLTENGLKKSILDATVPIVDLLKNEEIHNYELQQQGSENKVTLPCFILTGNELIETKISLYRPTTKSGDTRLWPGRFSNYASADQVFAVFVVNSNIVLLNLSDADPLDVSEGSNFSELLETQVTDEFAGIEINDDLTKVESEESSEIEEPSRFEVSSYGWDSDVEGLVKRMNRGDIKLPGFQRGFVWSSTEQSRFIESLILGLPVPNIFLAKDSNSSTLNIIDGQQRLKTLQRYLSGKFPISNSQKIHEDFRGRYFNRDVAKSKKSKVLEDADARTLSDSILHSIVIKPDPSSDSVEYGNEYNNAVIQIFRRLNTSGKPLQPQEVRSCIFYGPFDDLLHDLNKFEPWRNLFGPVHNRYKDVETILRFFALYEGFETYKAPMPSFLDKYMDTNRDLDEEQLTKMKSIFELTTLGLFNSCGESLFKTGGTFLLSKFDAVTVGLAKAIDSGVEFEDDGVRLRVERLLADPIYVESTEEFINDTGNVIARINKAIEVFSR
jgi:hypothetical protein